MKTFVYLLIALFAAFLVFDLGWVSLILLRYMMYGTGEIPGGGSAVDMAFFLLPLFLAYVAGDRVFAFLRKGRKPRDRAAG